MVHTGTVNNMKARYIPAIALKPLSESGGYTFMSLLSGKKICGVKWNQNPIPDKEISRVEQLTTHKNRSLLDRKELIFEWVPEQRFKLPTNIANEVHADIDDINNEYDITEGNYFNDEIVGFFLGN